MGPRLGHTTKLQPYANVLWGQTGKKYETDQRIRIVLRNTYMVFLNFVYKCVQSGELFYKIYIPILCCLFEQFLKIEIRHELFETVDKCSQNKNQNHTVTCKSIITLDSLYLH